MTAALARVNFAAVLGINRCDSTAALTRGETLFKPRSAGADTVLYAHPGAHLWPRDITPSVVKFFKEHPK